MDDRRKYPRMPADLIMMSELLSDSSDAKKKPIRTFPVLDISMGGIKVLSGQPLDMGLKMKITLMTTAVQQPLELTGEIVWLRPSPEDGDEVGIEFFDISESEEVNLAYLIGQLG